MVACSFYGYPTRRSVSLYVSDRRNQSADLLMRYTNHLLDAGGNDIALPLFGRPAVVRHFGTIECASRR